MKRSVDKLARKEYDVLIVGGGINGAAIANMASLNGLKIGLIEKGDFASGTSGKSTKLIHGGLRYLENLEFDLVLESLRERCIQLESAPHLVKPLPFIIPVYKKDKRPLWMMKLGILLYDFLSRKCLIEKHRFLGIKDILNLIPNIKKEGLSGGVLYYDAQMDDARLCLENVLSAYKQGGDIANYVEAKSFITKNGKTIGIKAYDSLGNKNFEIKAKRIICALGPWTNIFIDSEAKPPTQRIRATKGIHIVYKGQFSKNAILIPTQKDGRIFFVIPWKNNSLIGTTDTDFTGNPDEVSVKKEDIEYLLKEMRRVFPQISIKEENIITTFAGLRPLVHKKGTPSKLSRKHVICESRSGVFYVMGGKYTTYRKIAEDCLKRICTDKSTDIKYECPIYGGGEIKEGEISEASKKHNLDLSTLEALINLYGTRYKEVLSLLEKRPDLRERIFTYSPAIKAQIIYSIENEMACTKEDIFSRRLSLEHSGCEVKECLEEISKFLS